MSLCFMLFFIVSDCLTGSSSCVGLSLSGVCSDVNSFLLHFYSYQKESLGEPPHESDIKVNFLSPSFVAEQIVGKNQLSLMFAVIVS